MTLFEKLKDPVSSLTHLFGAVAALPCLVAFVVLSVNRGLAPAPTIAFVVFGIALILLYSASSIYHGVKANEKIGLALRKFDHMMIFVLIAGTYTPLCVVSLGGTWGKGLLIGIWAAAVIGICIKIFFITAPKWVSALIYVVMGWSVAIAFYPLSSVIPFKGLAMLVAGGLAYTIGAVIYSLKIKLPFKNVGCHEIFHVFVLVGSAFHVYFMFRYVLQV
jgi:hemolysin III